MTRLFNSELTQRIQTTFGLKMSTLTLLHALSQHFTILCIDGDLTFSQLLTQAEKMKNEMLEQHSHLRTKSLSELGSILAVSLAIHLIS